MLATQRAQTRTPASPALPSDQLCVPQKLCQLVSMLNGVLLTHDAVGDRLLTICQTKAAGMHNFWQSCCLLLPAGCSRATPSECRHTVLCHCMWQLACVLAVLTAAWMLPLQGLGSTSRCSCRGQRSPISMPLVALGVIAGALCWLMGPGLSLLPHCSAGCSSCAHGAKQKA